jgi:protein-S-isoprenylcysteine O-methyltransferase Ste14
LSEGVLNQPRKFWMRWRVRVGYPVAILYLVLASPTMNSVAWGAGLVAIGLLIRGAAAGHLRKDRELAITGPYARTRNPLYLGSAFLAVGFAMAGHSWWAGGLVVLYFAIFYYAVMKNEEDDLRVRFGPIFDAYAESVPLFFPSVSAKTYDAPELPGQSFSWDQYLRNREYRALIGTVGALGVLFLRMWLARRYGM